MTTAVEENKTIATAEVEVLRRWQGSPVNAQETCGVPVKLAEELAALSPPAVRIIRRNVPETAGIGGNGKIGGDAPVNHLEILFGLIGELVKELKAKK